MKSLAVFTALGAEHIRGNPTLTTVEVCGIPIQAAMIATPAPKLRRLDPSHATKVLVRVRAFSCNYRDKSIMLTAAGGLEPSFSVIGSDFSGDVVSVGRAVSQFSAGDRVIPNSAYEGLDPRNQAAPRGIPTNHGSSEFLLLEEQQLARIPHAMSYAQGAGFTIGAQTAYSMVRKLNPKKGESVLITAGSSNTALFTLAALRNKGVRTFVQTASPRNSRRFLDLGVEEVFFPDLNTELFENNERIVEVSRQLGGFNYVVDPFFDIYMSRVLPLMAPSGAYVSCGLYDQNFTDLGISLPAVMTNHHAAMLHALVNNLSIMGNCLGSSADLQHALTDFGNGLFDYPLDSVFSGSDVRGFLLRTYSSSDRFGKVIYQY